MARRARCWQVRSAITPQVSSNEATTVNVHAVLMKVASGQLLFLGSNCTPTKKPPSGGFFGALAFQCSCVEKLEPQPQVVSALGFLMTNCAPWRSSL